MERPERERMYMRFGMTCQVGDFMVRQAELVQSA